MNITITCQDGKKYHVGSDKYQFILSDVTKVKDEKSENFGSEVLTNKRFITTLEQLSTRLFELELLRSDAETLEQLLIVVGATRASMKDAGLQVEMK